MTAPNTHIRVSGTWKKVNKLYTKVSGSWKEINFGYVKVAGVWKEIFNNIVPGSTTYTTAGTHYFTIPNHKTLTVEVWGGGGGGGGCTSTVSGFYTYMSVVAGSSGGQSKWDNTLYGNGGTRAPALSTTSTHADGSGGSGGTASGGTTNTTGGSGGSGDSYYSVYSWYASSGAGGNGASGGNGGASRSVGPANGTLNGYSGSAPGGGGGGAVYLYNTRTSSGGGGGGGGYSKRTYSTGAYTPGSMVAVVVGAGGAGGNGTLCDGGAGAVGRVKITWS